MINQPIPVPMLIPSQGEKQAAREAASRLKLERKASNEAITERRPSSASLLSRNPSVGMDLARRPSVALTGDDTTETVCICVRNNFWKSVYLVALIYYLAVIANAYIN